MRVPEHERGPGTGIFRRRDGGGHIAELSRIKWLFLIARNSSFVYKGKAVDLRQVGRELGVRYVLDYYRWQFESAWARSRPS
jgi:hypothetical protein